MIPPSMLAVLLLWLPFAPRAAGAQATTESVIKGGFSIPLSDAQGIKTLFSGKEMRPLGNGRALVTQFRMTNRDPALIVEAPQCILNPQTFEASSSGPLKLYTADRRFSIEGEGFEWLHSKSRLVVSNKVHTLISGDVRTRPVVSAVAIVSTNNTTNVVHEIDSDQFAYDAMAGEARYSGNVRLVDPGWRLTCGVLTGILQGGGGGLSNAVAETNVAIVLLDPRRETRVTSEKAVYTSTSEGEQIALSGSPAWESPPYRGSSEAIILRSKEGKFVVEARGRARVHLPRPERKKPAASGPAVALPAQAVAPAVMMEITAAEYDFRPGQVVFRGEVRVDDPERQLRCEQLTAQLEPGADRVTELLAERKVELRVVDGEQRLEASGDRLRYVTTNGVDRVEVEGDPVWRLAPYEGRSQRLTIVSQAKEFVVQAEGNAAVKLPRGMMGPVQLLAGKSSKATSPSAVAQAQSPDSVEIRSEAYTIRPREAIFDGQVVVDQLPGRLNCDRLVAGFAIRTNRIDSLRAEGKVVVEQSGAVLNCGLLMGKAETPGGELTRFEAERDVRVRLRGDNGETEATGRNAVFTAGTGLIEMTGEPILRTTQGVRVTGARVLVWDVRLNKFSAAGPYEIVGPPEVLKRAGPEKGK